MAAGHARLHPVRDPSAWIGGALPEDAGIRQLDGRQAAALIDFARRWAAEGRGLAACTLDSFGSDILRDTAAETLAELRDGAGFVVLRGVDARALTIAESEIVTWVIGLHLGTPVTQNAARDLVCHVVDRGVRPGELNRRGYGGTAAIDFHNDRADLVGLFCHRKAREGGASSIVSATTAFNELLRTRPDVLPALRRGFAYDRRGEEPPGEDPIGPRVPAFDLAGDIVSCRYARGHIEAAWKRLGIPAPAEESAALDALDAVTARHDLQFRMTLQEGDMQLLNNYTVLHARTAYEDHDDPAEKRRMLRLWLLAEGLREMSEPRLMRFGRFYGNLGLTPADLARGAA
jgi:hypothetical protein